MSFRGTVFSKNLFLEKGVILAIISSIIMGFGDFFLGWGARITDPLMVNFFVGIFILIVITPYLIIEKKVHHTLRDVIFNRGLLLSMSVADNTGWVAYAFAMSLAPIGVATALSESSVIVAVILGLVVNREKLQKHQRIGLIMAIVSALILAAVTIS